MQQIAREPESIISWLSRIVWDIVRILAFGNSHDGEDSRREHQSITQDELDRRDYDNWVLSKTLLELRTRLKRRGVELTRLEENNFELERVAMEDALTGLLNERGAQAVLERELGYLGRSDFGAQDSTHDICVLVGDLNGFKALNDRAGHAAGDVLLQLIAKHLQATFLRREDIICRSSTAGDEFWIFLLDAKKEGAVQRAQNLVARLDSDQRFRISGNRVSIALGIAHAELTGGDDGLEVVKKLRVLADRAMYSGKRQQLVGSSIECAPDLLCDSET